MACYKPVKELKIGSKIVLNNDILRVKSVLNNDILRVKSVKKVDDIYKVRVKERAINVDKVLDFDGDELVEVFWGNVCLKCANEENLVKEYHNIANFAGGVFTCSKCNEKFRY